jgi:type IV pilus assembly protein PilC
MNAAGQTIASEIDAASSEEALVRIRNQGCYPTKLTETKSRRPRSAAPAGGKKLSIRTLAFGRVSSRALSEFTRQLSTLQDAGLPIVRSLKILHQQEKPGVLKNALADVTAGVEDGLTLSEAFSRHPRAFSRLYVNMVQAGETGGVLDVILERLAEFMEKAQRLRRRIIGAMIYPAAVIGFSILIVMGIMMFVVPKFQEIFRDFRTTLPSITVCLMATADFIAHRYGWLAVLSTPLLVVLFYKLLARTLVGREFLDRTKLRLPIVGKIVRKTATARFSRTLGTLLSAGVPILDALHITRDTVGNAVFEHALQRVHNAIREGEPFARPLRDTRIVDPIVTNMIDVGEETGDLDKMLMKIADNHDDQVDVLIGSLVSLLEPVMVIVLGGIVGTIVLAIFLPLINLLRGAIGEGAP